MVLSARNRAPTGAKTPTSTYGERMMTSTPTKARRAALPAALAVVIAIAVAALFGGQITPPPL